MAYLAQRYSLNKLSVICCKSLSDILNCENACEILKTSIWLDKEKLKRDCKNLIAENTDFCFKTKSFLESDRRTIKEILSLDSMTIREVEVFKHIMKWARNKILQRNNDKTLRDIVGDGIHLIRFPTMTNSEFAKHVIPYEVLVECEQLDIFRAIGDDQFHAIGFIHEPRRLIEK
ncbi:unnamed protein product [Dimorphilus gyrociliatus]|uniref:BACK domain-containing protein n=1 Tax=Dimorphilus gyrociliatus TaxID=2664684 RepID=A0A7I8W5V4_9ANNE|nr:unnamed protein product [Dimorphilus gyrociliatus]